MDLKQSLDRYLTSGPPDDGFDQWCEQTTEEFSEDFYNEHEDWIMENSGKCNKWFNELFYHFELTPKHAARIIEWAYNSYHNESNPPAN